MNRRASIKALLALGLSAVILGADQKPEGRESEALRPDLDGFIRMFDGQTLDGWEGLNGFWSVKDNAITGAEDKEHPAPQTFLIYRPRKFSDFELHFKYRFVTPSGNSGVQFRSSVIDSKSFRVGGYQADMDGQRGYDGTIYDEAGVAGGRGTMSNRGEKTVWDADNQRHNEKLPDSQDLRNQIHGTGEWNDVVLIARGPHVTYTINGHLMTDLTDESPKAVKDGVIGLQLHAGFVMEVQFKDLRIKPLEGERGS